MLLLSVGYGQGHHSAAAALAELYAAKGWQTRVVDACEQASPGVFHLTQKFYRFCVRQAPWLWGVTYSLTDTADWTQLIRSPLFHPALQYMRKLLAEYSPHLIICTYPLFAYMLDMLRVGVPYVVVVTDAREISRPWMLSKAPLVTVPDDVSAHMVRERYGLDEQTVVPAGFPVRRAFSPSPCRSVPRTDGFRVLYGAYRRLGGVVADVAALLDAFPQVEMTVLAGSHVHRLQRCFAAACAEGRLNVLSETKRMPELLAGCHFYIGKAGAATMFECYAAQVPAIVNFALPGQEQGNLELLLQDGAGCHAESTPHLIQLMQGLLASEAAGWHACCAAIRQADRAHGAEHIVEAIERKFMR